MVEENEGKKNRPADILIDIHILGQIILNWFGELTHIVGEMTQFSGEMIKVIMIEKYTSGRTQPQM